MDDINPLMNQHSSYIPNINLKSTILNYLKSFNKCITHNILLLGTPKVGKKLFINYLSKILDCSYTTEHDDREYIIITYKNSNIQFNFIIIKHFYRFYSTSNYFTNLIKKLPQIQRDYIDLIMIIHDLSKPRFDEEDLNIIKNLIQLFNICSPKDIIAKTMVLFNKSYEILDYNFSRYNEDIDNFNNIKEHIEDDVETFHEHINTRKSDFQQHFMEHYDNNSLMDNNFQIIGKIKKNIDKNKVYIVNHIPKYNINRLLGDDKVHNQQLKKIVSNKRYIISDNWLRNIVKSIYTLQCNPLLKLTLYCLLNFTGLNMTTYPSKIIDIVRESFECKPQPYPKISFCSKLCANTRRNGRIIIMTAMSFFIAMGIINHNRNNN